MFDNYAKIIETFFRDRVDDISDTAASVTHRNYLRIAQEAVTRYTKDAPYLHDRGNFRRTKDDAVAAQEWADGQAEIAKQVKAYAKAVREGQTSFNGWTEELTRLAADQSVARTSHRQLLRDIEDQRHQQIADDRRNRVFDTTTRLTGKTPRSLKSANRGV